MKNYFGVWKTGIIFAADLPTSEDNFRILDEIHEDIDVIKLSLEFGLISRRSGAKSVQNKLIPEVANIA